MSAAKGGFRQNLPFYFLIIGAYFFLTIPRAAQPGMFGDGMIYAVIARNLAEGVGSVWAPAFDSPQVPFYEHPPLGFALQSLAYRAFGDHLAVERVYSVGLGALTILMLAALWRRSGLDSRYDWLPTVFWLLPSTVTWTAINNMLDLAQGFWTTLAVLAVVCSLDGRARMLWGTLAGLATAAAVLTKGPTGLFPLAAPVAAALALGQPVAALQSGAAMLASAGSVALLLAAGSESRAALSTYLQSQVLASISGIRGADRWMSLPRHLMMGVMLRMAVLTALIWLPSRVRAGARPAPEGAARRVAFFFLIALAASVPVAISARIIGHYFVPSIAFFALGFAALTYRQMNLPHAQWHASRAVRRSVGSIGLTLTVAAVGLPLAGIRWEPRDAERVAEFRALAPLLPPRAIAGTCPGTVEDWNGAVYLQRFLRLQLDEGPARSSREFFLLRSDNACEIPAGCESAKKGQSVELFRCATSEPDRSLARNAPLRSGGL